MKTKLSIFGGNKSFNHKIGPQQFFNKEEENNIIDVIRNKELSGFLASKGENFTGGKWTKSFENELKNYYGVRYALGIQSATSALHASIAAIDLEPGDEVLVTPFSMVATATCIVMHNAIPIFVDIDPNTLAIDPSKLEENITKRTKAIVLTHLFGFPADMNEIMKVAKKNKLFVIEDSAQAPFAYYRSKYKSCLKQKSCNKKIKCQCNRLAGTIGDIGIFSLNQNKMISAGEGGYILTNNKKLFERIVYIRNHGEVVVDQYNYKNISGLIGYNYRITELTSSIAFAQLKKLKYLIDYKKKISTYFSSKLEDYNEFFHKIQNYNLSDHNYFVTPFLYNENAFGFKRDIFIKIALSEGIPINGGYIRPIYYEPMYQKKIAYGKKGYPFKGTSNKNKISYKKGLAPICEDMHHNKLITTNICRYPVEIKHIDSFFATIEKIILNISEIKKNINVFK